MPGPIDSTPPPPDPSSRPRWATHSLRDQHIAALKKVIAGLPGGWTLDCNESYDGDVAVLLTPQDGGSDGLVVSRSAAGFHLAATWEDDYQELGRFRSLEMLVSTLRETLALPRGSGPRT